jgi:5-aminolevulinate synthase
LAGDPHKCKQPADALPCKHAQYERPINLPSVPRGSERLQITPSPLHSPPAVHLFVKHIDKAWTEFKLLRIPDCILDGRSAFAADTDRQTVSA